MCSGGQRRGDGQERLLHLRTNAVAEKIARSCAQLLQKLPVALRVRTKTCGQAGRSQVTEPAIDVANEVQETKPRSVLHERYAEVTMKIATQVGGIAASLLGQSVAIERRVLQKSRERPTRQDVHCAVVVTHAALRVANLLPQLPNFGVDSHLLGAGFDATTYVVECGAWESNRSDAGDGGLPVAQDLL